MFNNAPPKNLLSITTNTNQQLQQQLIPTFNMSTNNQPTHASSLTPSLNNIEVVGNDNIPSSGTNIDLIKQLLNSNPQLQMYLHQLANQTENSNSMLTTSNNNVKVATISDQTNSTIDNILSLFNQSNESNNMLQHPGNYVLNHMPQLQEHNITSNAQPMMHGDSQHILSLYLSSEEVQQLLLLDQEATNNTTTLNQPQITSQSFVNPSILNNNSLLVANEQPPLFTCSNSGTRINTCASMEEHNNAATHSDHFLHDVSPSLLASQQNLPHHQKQNTANIVRKHSIPDLQLHQHQPIVNLLYSTSTTINQNNHHMIQPQTTNTQFNMEISPSPSLSLQINEMDFYDLQYMNQPLTDLAPQQYNRYIFDGCEFILPIRYSPIMRGSQVVFLGRGAYGHVIAANDTQSGTTVAIKKVQNVFDKAAYRMLRGL